MEQSTTAVIILICTMVLYIIEIIPISITSLLSCMAMGIFGCCSMGTVFSGFSNDVTIMVIGMCIVGDTLFHTGAATYLGSKLVALLGKNEKRFLIACILISAILSAFLSNSATVAMMLPIAGSAIAASGGKLSKKNIYMPIGFAAIAGGGCTLIGSTPQLVAQGILTENGLEPASFFEYLLTGIPKIIIMVVFFMTFGYKLIKRTAGLSEAQAADNKEGAMRFTPKMLISILILVGCIICFTAQIGNVAIISMLAASACIVTRCVNVKQAFSKLDWNTIFLLASALGVAACLNESGAGELIANSIVGLIGNDVNGFMILAVVALLASLLGNIVSTTASTAILAPICVYVAPKIGMDARTLVIAVVVFANVVYSTPTSTPPNSMTLVAGYRFTDYIKVGGLLNIITIAVLLIIFPLLYTI